MDKKYDFKTTGVRSFGEGERRTGAKRLLRVEPGHNADYVLKQTAISSAA